MTTSHQERLLADICQACGSCCDGTLFEYGSLNLEEDTKTIQLLDIKLEQDPKGLPIFAQPCRFYQSNCTVYDIARPSCCDDFFCRPMKQYKRGEVTLNNVDTQIKNLLRLKSQFLDESNKHSELQGQSIRYIRSYLYKIEQAEDNKEQKRQYAKLFLIGLQLFPMIEAIMPKALLNSES